RSHSHLHTLSFFSLFFFIATATTQTYTLSLHDALPILRPFSTVSGPRAVASMPSTQRAAKLLAEFVKREMDSSAVTPPKGIITRSEEHTSELQSQSNLVCRLLLEKKNK